MSRIVTGKKLAETDTGILVSHQVGDFCGKDWFPKNEIFDVTSHVDGTVSFTIPGWLAEKMFGEE